MSDRPASLFPLELDFRVDWGYQFVYSRRHYHPEYRWDGTISCDEGGIRSVALLEYPYTWWGPVYTPREIPLAEPAWQSTTRRGLAGIRVRAKCAPGALFTLSTAQGDFRFSAEQIVRDGRIVFPVGAKYSHCTLIVTRTGHLWFRPPARPQELVIEAADMTGVDVGSWSRMEQAWIEPGGSAAFEVTLPPPADGDGNSEGKGELSWRLHIQAMTAQKRDDPYALARDFMPMELVSDGRTISAFRRFFRYHDMAVQILHDVWEEIPEADLPPGKHRLELRNRQEAYPVLVHRVSFRPVVRHHLDLHLPRWALVGKPFHLRVQVLNSGARLGVTFDEGQFHGPDLPGNDQRFERGLHLFTLVPLAPGINRAIVVTDLDSGRSSRAAVSAIYDLPYETPEVKVGYDMTTVPHDDTMVMDHLLEYTSRTQLGNLVCFRPFPMGTTVPDELLARWGEFCREHRIYVQGINLEAGPLPDASGHYFHGIGNHELSGHVYFKDPDNESRTMRDAAERYTSFVREHVDQIRQTAPAVAFGDASGGHRYSLIAGADFLRAETMVANTMQHLSQARAAAQALGNREWGVHIAIQHAKQPYLESHLSQYYLSLLQPWMMGASFIYEEDSLFVMFKEERQGWDDRLTKGKRDMTRDFFRFASTHPRKGRPEVGIALLLGRYAAPFNGFICGCEQDPGYSVWGRFGREEPAWGHLQPEKSQQVMDVLMPGSSTHPLRQRYDRRRFFFSGTPYGDFDQVPVEAEAEFLSRYRLLLHLGWNTMIADDYESLRHYVEQGGTLLIGVPQLSTHESRDFLLSMDDLALFRQGDVSDLCGVRIRGKGVRYCGHWAPTGPVFQGAACPPLSRAPSTAPDEDGACHLADVELAGAVPVIVDAVSGLPLLVEYTLGRGRVYLITAWAYAGHEELSDFSGAVTAWLCAHNQGEYRVDDPSREVFWTWWPKPIDGCGRLMLLNTDWTEPGNTRAVSVVTPVLTFDTEVREGEVLIVTCLPFGAIIALDPEPHIEIVDADAGRAHLRIHATGQHRFRLACLGRLTVLADGHPVFVGTEGTHALFHLEWGDSTVIDCEIVPAE